MIFIIVWLSLPEDLQVSVTLLQKNMLHTVLKYFASIEMRKNQSELCETLKSQYHAKFSYFIADFAKLSDIHAVANHLASLDRDIDVLIHNAGVYMTKKMYTENNLEMVFQTNYLATFIINEAIKEKLKNQKHGRILFVNSEAHRFTVWGLRLDDLNWKKQRYSGLKSYSAAKMAQLLSMIKLNQYFAGSGVTVNAMHPGNVKTNSGQNNGKLYKIFQTYDYRQVSPVPGGFC